MSDALPDLAAKRILLVISGGIAAYKALELIRLLRKSGASVRAVLTKAGAEFVTALSVGALTEDKVYTDLWSLTDEAEMGHIRLSREADLIVIAPASADLLAKMAHGLADDLASTMLLAADKPVLVAPAMNVRMWEHPATIANLAKLESRGVIKVGPAPGPMACGEFGMGRMAEPAEILVAIAGHFTGGKPLSGRRIIVTSGPTQEAIDPVRFISNRSSGKQGHAIAAACATLGAETILVSGPTREPTPPGVTLVSIESAEEMLAACQAALPVDAAICAAAVSDWRPADPATQKIKKKAGATAPDIHLVQTPDILAMLSKSGPHRPHLVVGFALETENLLENAKAKLKSKGCDWIVANAATQDSTVFGSSYNTITLVTAVGTELWARASKQEVGRRLAEAIAERLPAAGKHQIGLAQSA
ncbi:MAG TPA: bifunctional phosphopantothenoylcysteine decarboxylase/phosphopantothenate--cysteine ligase CoaBC [Alphaproteobacteria bacterium]|nr:bifunctional phosphopantothenoylcysteine decarboxylase/phosphopantothenate--cysteine ligase CoaBC [Alphaproteobacteria bacterium]